ncbi:MAG: DUF5685 family protein [Clostridiales Family XIII bacterium]|jgi:hypothetical protein|nr:DUF5685 family protein [Clostridiales Family XIII bacterium]
MFGYIAPLKSELKVREFEVYSAFYCAICRSIKSRYGELPRLLLSYDSVFLALLSSSLAGGDFESGTFRCFVNPARKRNAAAPSAQIDYAADILVLLGWLSLKDDREDEGGFFAAAGEGLLRRAGGIAAKRRGKQSAAIRDCLAEISALEKEGCAEIDRAADPFGRLMAAVFDFPAAVLGGAEGQSDTLRKLGYHMGRYIYIIDAADDLEKDRAKGAYNPLLARESPRRPESLDPGLQLDLARMAEALDALPPGRYKAILENIVYLGLCAVKDEVLNHPFRRDTNSRRRRRLSGIPLSTARRTPIR